MFVGAMGADKGIPFMANDAGAKAYVRSLSLSLHEELESRGVHVTVLPPPLTETPVLEKFGLDAATMPMKPPPWIANSAAFRLEVRRNGDVTLDIPSP
jgi:short-subunit dehydrogenase